MIHQRVCQLFNRVPLISTALVQKEPSINFDRRLSSL